MNILWLGDMHCGSGVSIAKPGSKLNQDGGKLTLNKLQQYVLYPKWKEMCEGGPYDLVVANGDLVDGRQRKSNNTGLWTADLECQAKCAAELLNMIPLKKGGEVHVVGGTEYHTDVNLSGDREVVNQFNRLQDNREKNAVYQGLEYVLKVDGCAFHVSHTIGGGVYHGSVLNKEIMFRHLYKYEFDGMIRSHRHNFHFDWDGTCFAMMLPCWKARDSYEMKHGLKWALNKIGWVAMTVKDGEYDIDPTLYKLKDQMKEVKL